MKYLLVSFSIIATLFFMSSCSYFKGAVYTELEVSPQKKAYFKLTNSKDMFLKYDGKVIALVKTDTYLEPISIMENEGLIYLIMIDERGKRAADIKLEFYRQAGDKMAKIKPSEFPRNIAIQNIWPLGCGIEKRIDGSIRKDNIKIARERNIEDSNFLRSITANIWYYLETEKPFHTIYGGMVDSAFLKNYMEKYKPVMLDFKEMRRVTAKEAGF